VIGCSTRVKESADLKNLASIINTLTIAVLRLFISLRCHSSYVSDSSTLLSLSRILSLRFAMPAIRGAKSKKKTRRYTRDIDQIHSDLKHSRHLEQYKETKAAEDLPGLGQWYCIECSKWFADETNFNSHVKGKNHKRRYVL